METQKTYTAGGAIPRTYEHDGVQHTYYSTPSMSDVSPKATLGYGRLAGGKRAYEVNHIRTLMMAEMVRAGMPPITNATMPAVPSSKTLPKPYTTIVGRISKGIRRFVGRVLAFVRMDD